MSGPAREDLEVELTRLRREIEVARTDRDHVAALLLDAEQRVAMLLRERQEGAATSTPRFASLRRRAATRKLRSRE